MIRCKNKCPEGRIDGCCLECEERADCQSVCDKAVGEKVLECEDAIYEGAGIEVFESKTAAIINEIASVVAQKNLLEEKEKEIKAKLQKAMEDYGVKSFDNEVVKVTYIAPTTQTSIDSKRLKEKYPDVVAEFSRTSSKKGYVKVEVK